MNPITDIFHNFAALLRDTDTQGQCRYGINDYLIHSRIYCLFLAVRPVEELGGQKG